MHIEIKNLLQERCIIFTDISFFNISTNDGIKKCKIDSSLVLRFSAGALRNDSNDFFYKFPSPGN